MFKYFVPHTVALQDVTEFDYSRNYFEIKKGCVIECKVKSKEGTSSRFFVWYFEDPGAMVESEANLMCCLIVVFLDKWLAI